MTQSSHQPGRAPSGQFVDGCRYLPHDVSRQPMLRRLDIAILGVVNRLLHHGVRNPPEGLLVELAADLMGLPPEDEGLTKQAFHSMMRVFQTAEGTMGRLPRRGGPGPLGSMQE